MIYSHSRLSTFEQCPLKFRFRYIDRVEAPQEQGIEAFLGVQVHQALEKLYKDLKFSKLFSLKELLDFYNAEWGKNWNDQIIIVKKEYTGENYRKMGETFITDYYNRYKPFDQQRTIGLEHRVKVNLDKEGKFVLRGYVDRLAYANGVYEVHDYKTNANLPLQEYLENDRQLALYSMAVLEGYQDAKKVSLVWHFLAFDKEIVLQKTAEQLENLRKETIELVKKIEAEKEFKPRVSKLCDWCEFRPICPEWKHLYAIKSLPPSKYLQDSGVKLVNRLAELNEKKQGLVKELDSEIEEVKQAIIQLARKEGIDVVFGSNKKAKVWSKDCIKFPGKNDEEREELEDAVKGMGKWEEVSTLDIFALARIANERKWSPELLKMIQKFQRIEKVERVYLSKLRKEE